jgi:riboflavin kinase/FMN adenylyltransferase
VIAPPPEPFLLTTIDERLHLLEPLGLAQAIVVRFDDALRRLPAQRWMELLEERVGMRHLVCGANYTFGRDRGGAVELLRAWAAPRSIRVHVTPPVHVGGTLVGSTLIRRLLRAGDVREAARCLGRWYALGGTVARGDARGRRLGIPTANLAPAEEKLIPGPGIYAAFARTEGGAFRAAVSIGTRPTFGPGAVVVEAHLLGFSGDLYGRALELHLVQRLRDEIAFTSEAALVRQMQDDVAETGRLLAGVPAPADGDP